MAVLFNPFTGEFTVTGGGSTTTNSFTIIQPDSGTSPTATSSASTLTLQGNDANIYTVGDSATNSLYIGLQSTISVTKVNTHGLDMGNGSIDNAGTVTCTDVSTSGLDLNNGNITNGGDAVFANINIYGGGHLRLSSGIKYTQLLPNASIGTSYSMYLPQNQGTGALTNDGAGNLSWAAAAAATWGSITGTLSSQTDLNTALSGKQATGNYITALTGEVTASGPGSVSSTVSNAAVIGKVLTGFSAASGTVASTDTILQAVNKLVGNDALKAPIASPTFTGVITAPSNSISPSAVSGLTAAYFGDGVDGALTISSGTTTLTRDTFYSNVTISGTASINTAGFRLFVSGTLDLTAAPANAITGTGNTGGTTATAAGGAAGATLVAGTLGTGGAAGAGASGGTAAGGTGTAAGTQLPANGGTGGDGNTGGTGSSGAGGGGGTGGALSFGGPFNRIAFDLQRGLALYVGGAGGGGGGGGGGDTVQAGGGGGGGGGGRVLYIAANVVSRGGSTAVGAISADGGAGGSGASISGNKGGGAGGGGGGGGWIYMLVGSVTGSTATNAISVSGGLGGSGANGSGTGTGGKGGNGGSGGRVTLLNLGTNTITSIFGSTGTTGSNNVGITGGAGGAGNATRVNL